MKLYLRILLWAFLSLTISCSCSRPPSENEIKRAITECLKQEVPVSWSGSLMGGRNAQIELIEIKQIGRFKGQGRYWPVKARVKGICEADLIFSTEKEAFDRVGDFKLYKDNYGNWKARIETMQ